MGSSGSSCEEETKKAKAEMSEIEKTNTEMKEKINSLTAKNENLTQRLHEILSFLIFSASNPAKISGCQNHRLVHLQRH